MASLDEETVTGDDKGHIGRILTQTMFSQMDANISTHLYSCIFEDRSYLAGTKIALSGTPSSLIW